MAGELFTEGLRLGTIGHWIAAPELFEDIRNPKLSELNTNNDRLILNITCIDEEAFNFTLTGSDIDDRRNFCDGPGVSRPSKINPELSVGLNRDKDRNANGNYNKALTWFLKPDRSFIWITRIGDKGVSHTDPFTLNDERLYIGRFRTDYPIDTLAVDAPALLTVEPKNDSFIRWNMPPVA